MDEVTKKEEGTLIEKLFNVGAHFGYVKSRRHPTVKPYIFGNKNKIEILDLEKTEKLLIDAKNFARSLGEKNATILFLGGKNESKKIIETIAESISMPYVIGRWIGGTFTNFPEIKRRIDKLNDFKASQIKGDFSKYTKWERVQIDREIEKLEKFFGGISAMTKMPDALFVVDAKKEHIAVSEAKNKKIPVIAIVGSDSDLKQVAYPILGNDSSRKAIEFFTREIVSSYNEGKASIPKKVVEVAK